MAECREILCNAEARGTTKVDAMLGTLLDAKIEGPPNLSTAAATPCKCAICAHMDIIEGHWQSFVPDDGLWRTLKRHIDDF